MIYWLDCRTLDPINIYRYTHTHSQRCRCISYLGIAFKSCFRGPHFGIVWSDSGIRSIGFIFIVCPLPIATLAYILFGSSLRSLLRRAAPNWLACKIVSRARLYGQDIWGTLYKQFLMHSVIASICCSLSARCSLLWAPRLLPILWRPHYFPLVCTTSL